MNKRLPIVFLLAWSLLGFCRLPTLRADVPRLINYQGRLTDDSGLSLNLDTEVTFSLYTRASGGAAVWSESQQVTVTDGIFNLLLGSQNPLEPDYFSAYPETYLGVKVGSESEMTPRQAITSVAYSLKTAGISVKEDKVGIGTDDPGARLEVNGAIKFSANGSTITRAPRVIYTPDTRTGCPPAAAANKDLYTQSFTVENTAYIVVMVSTIAQYTGRVDTMLCLDGNSKRSTLTSTNSNEWKPVTINWGGTVAPGSHTVSIRSTRADAVGCGETWGGITTIIYE